MRSLLPTQHLEETDGRLAVLDTDPVTGTRFVRFRHEKKEHKPKLLSPDIFRWGRGLPHEGVGAKKCGMSLKTREIKFFWRDIRDFAGIFRGGPKSLRKKCLG